jgi:tryptophan synthase alpha chain
VNQRAAERGLASGTTRARVLDLAAGLKAGGLAAPLVLFTYLNPLLALGRRPGGVDAVLVLDPDDGEEPACLEGLDRIRLAAPSTTDARLRAIGARAGSFVYYVSRYGVTGARATWTAASCAAAGRPSPACARAATRARRSGSCATSSTSSARSSAR